MTRLRCSLAILGLICANSYAEAQDLLVAGSAYKVRYRRVSRRGALYVSAGSFIYGPVYGSRYYYGPGVLSPVSQVAVFYERPAPPSPIVIALPAPREPQVAEATPRREPEPEPPIDPPLVGRDAGVFRPLEDDNRARARRLDPLPLPEEPREEKPKPRGKAEVPPDATFIDKGRAAFVEEEFGRAAEFFRRAALDDVHASQPHFLLSQTYLALGKYTEAVESIRIGMALRRDWPTAKFNVRELYEPRPDEYLEAVHRLEETLHRHPDDPTLLFLLGHQLWFDGRSAEARTLFQRARPRFTDPALIDRFLALLSV